MLILFTILDTKLGDPDPSEFTPSPDFVFAICCSAVEIIPTYISQVMHVFKVEDPPLNDNSNLSPEDAALNEVLCLVAAPLYCRLIICCMLCIGSCGLWSKAYCSE